MPAGTPKTLEVKLAEYKVWCEKRKAREAALDEKQKERERLRVVERRALKRARWDAKAAAREVRRNRKRYMKVKNEKVKLTAAMRREYHENTMALYRMTATVKAAEVLLKESQSAFDRRCHDARQQGYNKGFSDAYAALQTPREAATAQARRTPDPEVVSR